MVASSSRAAAAGPSSASRRGWAGLAKSRGGQEPSEGCLAAMARLLSNAGTAAEVWEPDINRTSRGTACPRLICPSGCVQTS